jgi:PAS domain S-box-containing protein
MLILIALLLRRTVVSPLTNVARHIVRINENGDLSSRLSIERTDEIGTVGQEFDRLLGRIEDDLERREEAETALRESEARIRAILDAAPDGILTMAEDRTIESANPAAERIFGYDTGKLAGRNLEPLLDDGAPEPGTERIRAYIEAPSGLPNGLAFDAAGRRQDGSVFPLHITMSTLRLADRQLFIAIVRDMTEYAEIHEKLARAQHLAAIGEMGASVAHEIRNPLTGIDGALHLIGDSLREDDLKREIVQEALTQIRRVERTVRDLLIFARPWKPEQQECSMGEIIESARDDADVRDASAGVGFEIDVAKDLRARVDPYLFRQVLVNVFRNAAQAMPEGGRVSVSAAQVAGMVRIKVADTGEGIPEDVLKKVFQPFYTTRTRGSGLGLAVCRRIMESQDGTIALSSTPGEGTTVTLELPTGD